MPGNVGLNAVCTEVANHFCLTAYDVIKYNDIYNKPICVRRKYFY